MSEQSVASFESAVQVQPPSERCSAESAIERRTHALQAVQQVMHVDASDDPADSYIAPTGLEHEESFWKEYYDNRPVYDVCFRCALHLALGQIDIVCNKAVGKACSSCAVVHKPCRPILETHYHAVAQLQTLCSDARAHRHDPNFQRWLDRVLAAGEVFTRQANARMLTAYPFDKVMKKKTTGTAKSVAVASAAADGDVSEEGSTALPILGLREQVVLLSEQVKSLHQSQAASHRLLETILDRLEQGQAISRWKGYIDPMPETARSYLQLPVEPEPDSDGTPRPSRRFLHVERSKKGAALTPARLKKRKHATSPEASPSVRKKTRKEVEQPIGRDTPASAPIEGFDVDIELVDLTSDTAVDHGMSPRYDLPKSRLSESRRPSTRGTSESDPDSPAGDPFPETSGGASLTTASLRRLQAMTSVAFDRAGPRRRAPVVDQTVSPKVLRNRPVAGKKTPRAPGN